MKVLFAIIALTAASLAAASEPDTRDERERALKAAAARP